MSKTLFIEVNSKTKAPLKSEEQENPYLMLSSVATECIEATEEQIKEAKIHFSEHKKCKIHLIYDEELLYWYSRTCLICNKEIALI